MKARDGWSPEHLRVYHLRPWEMAQFTAGELAALTRDVREMRRAALKAQRGG